MKNKVYIAQLNSIAGDVEYNKKKAIECIKNLTFENADLVIFPEMFPVGKPLGNILSRFPHIFKQCEKALDEISKISNNISILINCPIQDKDTYCNSVCYINKGNIEKIIKETSSIDEKIIELNGIKYGIIIAKNENKELLLTEISKKVDYLIFISSEISRTNKAYLRHNYFKNIATKYKRKIIYVNQTGANDECVFEGASSVYDENGEITVIAKSFIEDVLNIDNIPKEKLKLPVWHLKGLKKEFSLDYEDDLERTYRAIVFSIKEYFSKNGLERAVLGLSGGLDSSVCAVLLSDALGKEKVLGVSMPSKITSSDSKNDAKLLAENLGIHFLEMPIKEMQDLFNDKLENIFSKINWSQRYSKSYTKDNIQARIRATILWCISNEYPKTIPIATSDKSETYMGYATINGDMSGGFAPISDVTKTKLFALARWINKNHKIKNVIPNNIIIKPPGAELAINNKTGKALTAEEALMPYEFLDEVIWRIENFNQTINDMFDSEFLYEKKNSLPVEKKHIWLEKFFSRMNQALYKWYISAPGPIVDIHSINKAEYSQPITSNINY